MYTRRWHPLAVFVLALQGVCAQAWNDTGHMLTARLAYESLTPEARRKALDILAKHPRFAEDLKHGMPAGCRDPNLYIFMRAATWPDLIRDKNHPLHAQEHHSNWHYVNYPFTPGPGDREKLQPPEPEAEGGKVDNILKALARCVNELRAEETPPERRAIALCWVLHLCADTHQPLHTTALFSAQFPQGDRGGNLFCVHHKGAVTNLHRFWDDVLGTSCEPDALDALARQARAAVAHAQPAPARDAKRPYGDWALESFTKAVNVVYDQGRLKGMNADDHKQTPAAVPQELPAGYEQKASLCALVQIAKAGERTAQTLTEALGGKPRP